MLKLGNISSLTVSVVLLMTHQPIEGRNCWKANLLQYIFHRFQAKLRIEWLITWMEKLIANWIFIFVTYFACKHHLWAGQHWWIYVCAYSTVIYLWCFYEVKHKTTLIDRTLSHMIIHEWSKVFFCFRRSIDQITQASERIINHDEWVQFSSYGFAISQTF